MQTEQKNYGVAEGPVTGMSNQNERRRSVLSHLNVFLNL